MTQTAGGLQGAPPLGLASRSCPLPAPGLWLACLLSPLAVHPESLACLNKLCTNPSCFLRETSKRAVRGCQGAGSHVGDCLQGVPYCPHCPIPSAFWTQLLTLTQGNPKIMSGQILPIPGSGHYTSFFRAGRLPGNECLLSPSLPGEPHFSLMVQLGQHLSLETTVSWGPLNSVLWNMYINYMYICICVYIYTLTFSDSGKELAC